MLSASGYSVTPLSPFFSSHPLHLPNSSPPFIFQLHLEFCEFDGRLFTDDTCFYHWVLWDFCVGGEFCIGGTQDCAGLVSMTSFLVGQPWGPLMASAVFCFEKQKTPWGIVFLDTDLQITDTFLTSYCSFHCAQYQHGNSLHSVTASLFIKTAHTDTFLG